jgi:Concanavalin A-like lectin/glucanases superfamily
VSIATAIAALAPTVYWKLDDATGPAASDSSGGGFAGVYGGNFSLLAPGPETGTFAAVFNGPSGATPGRVSLAAQTALTTNKFTLLVWMANLSADAQLASIIACSSVTNGGSLTGQKTGSAPILGVTKNNISNTPLTNSILDSLYHCYAVVFDATTRVVVDGIQVGTAGGNPNAANNGCTMSVASNDIQGAFCHFAAWNNVALTNAQIAGIVSGRGAAQELPTVCLPVFVADTNTLLNEILAAVRQTYQNAP